MKNSIFDKNVQDLTDKITARIGFTISNKSAAIEILSRYENANVKTIKRFTVKKNAGILNGTLIFN